MDNQQQTNVMFTNYLKVTLRNLLRHRLYTFINIIGLSLGIACCLLILLFVRHEWSYDSFHKNAASLFRVLTKSARPSGEFEYDASQPMPLAPALHAELPEVTHTARFRTGTMIITCGDKAFSENVTFTDPDIFSMFDIEFVSGSAASALHSPNDMVLTAAIARKFFGEENPLGKLLSLQTQTGAEEFLVAGVIKPLPTNSSVQFDLLANMVKNSEYDGKRELWSGRSCDLFVQLAPETSAAGLQRKIPAFIRKYYSDLIKREQDQGDLAKDEGAFQIEFQPIRSVYLDTRVRGSREEQSSPLYSYILSGVAIVVLLIACINFTMLTIGRSANRAKEIGIRKVVGAFRFQLLRQFLGEALFLCFVALLFGIAATELFLPTFNQLANKQLSLAVVSEGWFIASVMGLFLTVGCAAGSYPALILSSFAPVEVLKKTARLGGKNLLTQFLVVLQFGLSIFLISGALVMSRQLHFLLTKDLGYHAAPVVVIPTYVSDSNANVEDIVERLRNRAGSNPNIVSVSATSVAFAHGYRIDSFRHNGKTQNVVIYRVDEDYLRTLGIELKEGRNFSKGRTGDKQNGIIVNEAFLRALRWNEPAVGKRLTDVDVKELDGLEVIGVVKDFHFTSLREEIRPVILWQKSPMRLHHILVRLAPSNIPATIAFLKNAWQEAAPDRPFNVSFLDQDVQRTYEYEMRWANIIEYSSLFAVSLACLGLLGLAALTVANRTKEIGIRKVLGASVAGVVSLFSRDLIKLVLLANLFAWPLAYNATSKWLQNFAYRVDLGWPREITGLQFVKLIAQDPTTGLYFLFSEIFISRGWWMFALAGGLALVIALFTVSTQAIKVVLANPVDSLRYE